MSFVIMFTFECVLSACNLQSDETIEVEIKSLSLNEISKTLEGNIRRGPHLTPTHY